MRFKIVYYSDKIQNYLLPREDSIIIRNYIVKAKGTRTCYEFTPRFYNVIYFLSSLVGPSDLGEMTLEIGNPII